MFPKALLFALLVSSALALPNAYKPPCTEGTTSVKTSAIPQSTVKTSVNPQTTNLVSKSGSPASASTKTVPTTSVPTTTPCDKSESTKAATPTETSSPQPTETPDCEENEAEPTHTSIDYNNNELNAKKTTNLASYPTESSDSKNLISGSDSISKSASLVAAVLGAIAFF